MLLTILCVHAGAAARLGFAVLFSLLLDCSDGFAADLLLLPAILGASAGDAAHLLLLVLLLLLLLLFS